MKHKNKKGQIEQLQGIIIALIVVAIVLVVGFLIFSQAKTQVVDMISTSTTLNESFTFANNTLTTLTNTPHAADGSVTCIAIANDSGWTMPITTGVWTCNSSGVRITDPNGTMNIAATLYTNYTYKAADYAYNATSDVQNATQDIPGWLPIIVVVVIGGLLIGLVSFLRNQAR